MSRFDFLNVPANEQIAIYLYRLIASMELGKRRHTAARYDLYRALLFAFGVLPEDVFDKGITTLLHVKNPVDPWEDSPVITTTNWREEASLALKEVGPDLQWDEQAFLIAIQHLEELVPFEMQWLDSIARWRRRSSHLLARAGPADAGPLAAEAPRQTVAIDGLDDDVPF